MGKNFYDFEAHFFRSIKSPLLPPPFSTSYNRVCMYVQYYTTTWHTFNEALPKNEPLRVHETVCTTQTLFFERGKKNLVKNETF